MADNGSKYSVTLGVKLPVPSIPYSSFTTSLTICGDDYEEVSKELLEKFEVQCSTHMNEVKEGVE